jgi:hypothetical protein
MGRRFWLWIGAAGILLMAVAIAIRRLTDTAPESDFALIDLSVLRVFHGWQAVGAYSRFGWSHPGPLYFQLLAPLYELSGHRHLSIVTTVAAINGACLVAIAAILRRYSAALAIAAVVWLAVYVVRLDGLLASPWNPYVPLLPLALLLVSAAAAASGAYRLLPLVAALASFVVQTHVAFLAVTAMTIGIMAAIIAIDVLPARREKPPDDGSLRRGVAVAVLVTCVVWLVPIVDEVRPAGAHNFQRMSGFFTHAAPHDPRLAARAFEHLIIAPLSPGLRLWGDTRFEGREPGVRIVAEVQAAGLVIAAGAFLARRQRFESRLAIIALGASLAGLVAVRALPEAPLEYTLKWVTILGAINWIVVTALLLQLAWSVAMRGAGRPARLTSAWVTAAVTVALIGECTREIRALRAIDVQASPRIQKLAELVRLKVRDAGVTDPLVHVPQAFWGVATGVVLQLRLDGLRPRVDADWVSMFGQDCTPTGNERVRVALAQFEEHSEDLRHRSDYERLGAVDGIFAYAVNPPPASDAVPAPLNVVDHSAAVVAPRRISDDELGQARDATSASAVTFSSGGAYVTVELPATRAIGVRVLGQPGSTWQLRCAHAGGEFARIGRVTVGDDGSGTSFLWTLDGCRLLKISPAAEGDSAWLTELQVLAAPPAIKGL